MMDITKHRLDHGAQFPYDAGAGFWEDRERNPPLATDWAHAAARGVFADLCDRRGIKWELDKVDHEVRVELVQSVSEIIRLAAGAAPVPSWVSVAERLPEHEDVEFYSTDMRNPCRQLIGRFMDGKWMCAGYEMVNVTHWKPLAAAPKEQL